MVRDPESEHRPAWHTPLRRLLALNIRSKIVVPYLILTLIVAIAGTYVVTNLVAGSLEERLANQLIEAGQVVSDSLARRELDHLDSARAIAFTVGLAEAVQAGDQERVAELSQRAAAVRDIESIIVVDARGQEMLHLLRLSDGSFQSAAGQFDVAGQRIVQALLEAGDPDALPRRGLVLYSASERYYYLTAIPIELNNKMVGVTVVGTSLDTLLQYFRETSLANVIIYLDGGRAVATTFASAGQSTDTLLDEISTTPALYKKALQDSKVTIGESVRIRDRSYGLARGALHVGNDSIGVFAVVLPLNFIIQAGATSRNTYALIFGVAMAAVILVGYVVSQRITRPLNRLVRTSQAVAEGNLEQRTGIVSTDEVGILAETFDEMTGRLSERTRALEEAVGRMRAILSSIGDGVILEDREGNLNPLNAAAEVLLDEMSENFALGPLRELSVEEYDQIEDLQPSPWLLERRRFQVGRKVISAHSAAVRTEKGEHLGTAIVLRDVTAEAEAERLKDAFITHVSHELRTPLTAIKGYSELLLVTASGSLDAEKLGFLETISRHTDNLVAMINELLDFSEMEAGGRLGLRRRPVLLTTLIEEIAQEVRPQIEQKGLTFQVEISAELPLVDADTRRLRWAVINLVRNAWQYTPAGGNVTLRLYGRNSQVVLDIADTGIGISSEDQERLFARFYRVTNVTADDVRGLGLGLYVTKAIIEAHGGTIQVASREGGGSTFSVILPASQEHQGEKGTGQSVVEERK